MRLQMQDTGDALGKKEASNLNWHINIKPAISKPPRKHKPKIYSKYTSNKEKAIQIQYRHQIKRLQKKRRNKTYKNKTIKMEIRTYISIISLHVNRLNALTKTLTG